MNKINLNITTTKRNIAQNVLLIMGPYSKQKLKTWPREFLREMTWFFHNSGIDKANNARRQVVSSVMKDMMTSSNRNIFRVTGHLCGEFTGPRWIPRTKASDAELWCFIWSVSE